MEAIAGWMLSSCSLDVQIPAVVELDERFPLKGMFHGSEGIWSIYRSDRSMVAV